MAWPASSGAALHGQSVAGSLPRASRTANHVPRSPAGREHVLAFQGSATTAAGVCYAVGLCGGPPRWVGACPIADEENSQRSAFFLSMGGNLYFTCAAQHSVGVSGL